MRSITSVQSLGQILGRLVQATGNSRLAAPSSPTRAVLLFLLVVLALIIGSGVVLVWRDYQDTVSRIETSAANAAHTAAEHARWLVEATLLVLERVDNQVGPNPSEVFTDFVAELDTAVADLPNDPLVFVANDAGATVLSTNIAVAPRTVAATNFFQELELGAGWVISPLLNDLLPEQRVFVIARQIQRSGTFLGIAGVVFPAEQLGEFWASLALGRDSSVGLIRSDGLLVTRTPVPAATLDLSDGQLFAELRNAPTGVYHSGRSPADGIARVVGFYTVPGLPLVTIAGISLDVGLSRFWGRVWMLVAFSTPLGIALVVLGRRSIVLSRRSEEHRNQLSISLTRNETLLAEIHHRVKNNLQLVSSLVHLQPGPIEAKRELTRRIHAVSAVHEQIYTANRFGAINLPTYIENIVSAIAESYGLNATIVYDVEPVELDIEQAFTIALILSEVISNSFKHAFKGSTNATLNISARQSTGMLYLSIKDNGPGFGVDVSSSGFGTKLLRSLASQLGANYTLSGTDGTTFEIRVPYLSPLR